MEMASEMLASHETVLWVEDMGEADGLGLWLSLVNTTAVYDAVIWHVGAPGQTRYGIDGTPEFVLAVLREVDVSAIWCPTPAQALERAEQLEAGALRQRSVNLDLAGQMASLARAERRSA